MKVKVIAATNLKEFENVINEFIKDKIVYDIKYTSIVANNVAAAQNRALIMYDEPASIPLKDCKMVTAEDILYGGGR